MKSSLPSILPFMITIRYIALFLLTFALLFIGGQTVYGDDPTAKTDTSAKVETKKSEGKKAAAFTGEQLKLKNLVESLFKASQKVNAGGSAGKQARAKIEGAVDWGGLAKSCLGGTSGHTSGERKQFEKLLREIISLTAYSRMGSFWDGTTYTFSEIKLKNKKEATVKATFNADDEEYELAYHLKKSGKRWKMVDLSFDEIKHSENLREQIQTFLKGKDKKFSNLLSTLRKRKAALVAKEKSKKS